MKPGQDDKIQAHAVRELPKSINATPQPGEHDPVIQNVAPQPNMPAPLVDFEGTGNEDNSTVLGFRIFPPDTNGDVGPNHYFMMVNLLMEVFDKTGTSVMGPLPLNSLYTGFGGDCEFTNDGDPVVLYDDMADRWLISQFVATVAPPYSQCICISQTGDPTGAYYRYQFVAPNNLFPDYPHYGVWPDGYYMMDHQFDAASAFAGSGVYSYDRAKMLVGDPTATYIYFDLNLLDPFIGGHLPSDADGLVPPPAGTSNIFLYPLATEFGDAIDGLRIFEFHADHANPLLSTFTEPNLGGIAVAAFDPITPIGRDDIPQPPPATATAMLDAIGDRMMHRLQYRNFGTYESLVVNHTVDASGDPSDAVYQAAPRYYELRRVGGNGAPWTVQEQATFAPDASHRWMGSAAQDNSGNIAVGYSTSSAAIFPSIQYAGRLATDPPNGLFQGEATLMAGLGSQAATASRWGDYSALSVDPTDGCTFWYTNEYYPPTPGTGSIPCPATNTTACWHTRIGSFRFPSCVDVPQGTLQGVVTDAVTAAPLAGATVKTAGGYSRVTDAAGAYSMPLAPGSHDVTASAGCYVSSTVLGVTITNAGTTTQNFSLARSPGLAFNSAVVSGGDGNGIIDANECVDLSIQVDNICLGSATGVSGVLTASTAGVTVTGGFSSYPDIPSAGSGTNTTPYTVSIDPAFVCGPISFSLAVTTAQGNFTLDFTVPAGTVGAPVRFDNNTPVAILDLATVTSPMVVSGVSGSIANVIVSLQIDHTFDRDLILTLIAPNGTTAVQLANGVGLNGDNFGTFCFPDSSRTTFDDAAATPIGAGAAPFVGSFQPQEPLSGFDGSSGVDLNGTWTMQIDDTFAGDVGSLNCWSLVIEPLICGDGGGVCPDPCAGETIAPVVTPPADLSVPQSFCMGNNEGATGATRAALAAFLVGDSAVDNCDLAPIRLAPQVAGVDVDNSSFFAIGMTTVTFRWQDFSGNAGTATANVTVTLYFDDLNQDGSVNAGDSVILSNYLVGNLTQGPAPFTAPLDAADGNQDTIVNAVDSVILANYLVGNIGCLPTP